MTYIEFFDKPDIENIILCLAKVPDTVIFIGKSKKKMYKHIENYEKVFRDRGYNIEFKCEAISQGNLNLAIDLLTKIVDTYDDCHFNLDGGEEILTVALGVVLERRKEKNIQLHKFNFYKGDFYDCDNDGQVMQQLSPQLTIDENVKVYGGEIIRNTDFEDQWKLSDDFVKDINKMWSISRKAPTEWNAQTKALGNLESGEIQSKKLLVVDCYSNNFQANETILRQLKENQLITEYSYKNDNVHIVYKNEQVKKCLTRAGLILELKIFTTMKELKDEQGNPIYNDVETSVVIDWDGEIHKSYEHKYDTINEIDVMAMHGVIPIFISCKNGQVDHNELNKLTTVANRFGGDYAKKVLIMTNHDNNENFIKQRAADMRVRVISITDEVSNEELAEKLANLWIN